MIKAGYLYDALKQIYPNITEFDYDATLQENGTAKITAWRYSQPQPSDADIKAQEFPAAKAMKRRELRIAQESSHRRIFEVDGTFIQADRDHLMRRELKTLIPTPGTPALSTSEKSKLQQIDDVRTRLQQRLSDVANATDVPGVEAVSW